MSNLQVRAFYIITTISCIGMIIWIIQDTLRRGTALIVLSLWAFLVIGTISIAIWQTKKTRSHEQPPEEKTSKQDIYKLSKLQGRAFYIVLTTYAIGMIIWIIQDTLSRGTTLIVFGLSAFVVIGAISSAIWQTKKTRSHNQPPESEEESIKTTNVF
jgi:uncharacterized membrane protein YqjE